MDAREREPWRWRVGEAGAASPAGAGRASDR
eukprot:COSAG01_NODE_61945_length_287_cov_0.654255_1_plen_30_part_10